MRFPRRSWYVLVLALLTLPFGAAAVSTVHSGSAAQPGAAARRDPTIPPQAGGRHDPRPDLTPGPRGELPPAELTPAAWAKCGKPAAGSGPAGPAASPPTTRPSAGTPGAPPQRRPTAAQTGTPTGTPTPSARP